MAENKQIQSLARAMSVIETMSQNNEMGITEIAKAVSLSKATVFRILDTLVTLGYVIKNPQSEKYSLTLKFLKISSSRLAHYDIHEKIHPLLEEISHISGETVHLVEHQGENVVYIDKCESNQNSVRMVSRIGMTLEIFTTAVGKAILSHLPDSEIARLWEDYPHEKKTACTITNLEDYLQELKKVREDGYAIDDEENELDVRCVAVAVADAYNEYKYAVSISAPKNRSDKQALTQRANLLRNKLGDFL